MVRLKALATLCLLALCNGCGRRVSSDLAFQAPKGWVHVTLPGSAENWLKAGAPHEWIMAQVTESPLPHRPDYRAITICGDHPATLIIQRNVQTNNPDQIWEGVSTNWGTERYMVVYVRPSNVPADPNAEAAIRTLCLKR